MEASRAKYGANTYTQVPPKSFFAILYEGFKDPVILLLCAAATVSNSIRPVRGNPRRSSWELLGAHCSTHAFSWRLLMSLGCSDAAQGMPGRFRLLISHDVGSWLLLFLLQLSTVIGAAIPEERGTLTGGCGAGRCPRMQHSKLTLKLLVLLPN